MPRILIATDNADNAQLIRKLLRDEFDSIAVSNDPAKAVEDFDTHQPAVLLLAFDTLEKCERYYLGLYRLGAGMQSVAHRTVVLCNKDDVRQVYQLCRKEYFDDYVLFWPMGHDATRLPMAIHHALRHAAATARRPLVGELAIQARRLGGLDASLAGQGVKGRECAESIGQSLAQASTEVGATLDRLSHWLGTAQGAAMVEGRERSAIEREITRLKSEDIARHMQSAADSLEPARRWAGSLEREFAPQIESMRTLCASAERVRRVVLVVDDDEFQRKLLARMLGDAGFETLAAESGVQALAQMGKQRPDIVLMDIDLPDLDGVQTTQRIKAVEHLAGIPVLMITGHSDKDMVMRSFKAGAAGFLVKPFNKDVLLAKLASCLDAPAR
jgi:CheY-like chemotaxis protein